jgi:hypothetical protein
MKNRKILAGMLTVGALLAISAKPAHAQAVEAAAAAAEVVAPIVTKVVSTVTQRKDPHGNWLKAEVVRADSYTIIVHDIDNERMIHTFTFGPAIKDQMQAIQDKGGYQYGDKVRILISPDNTTVALKVFGKPSKPL